MPLAHLVIGGIKTFLLTSCHGLFKSIWNKTSVSKGYSDKFLFPLERILKKTF